MERKISQERKILFDDYSYREMSAEEFEPLFQKYRPKIFSDTLTFNVREALSFAEREAMIHLEENLSHRYTLRVGIFFRTRFIGWSFGWQEAGGKFYMCNTAIFREHQNKGVYSKILPEILSILREKGFQIVYSRHIATNNQVLIPKLRAGFVVSGFNIADNHGIMVVLSYYFNEKRRRAIDVRTGLRAPDEEMKKFFSLE